VRLTDLLTLPLAALWQQKIRTLLTTLGVIFGAFVLAASLSIGQGVQETIDRESHRSEISRRIDVSPKWNFGGEPAGSDDLKVEGNMTDARRARLRKSLQQLKERFSMARVMTALTRERMAQLAALPNVKRLVPSVRNDGFVLFGKKSEAVQVLSARPDDEACRRRIVAGRFFDAPDQRSVVVSEPLAYQLGAVNDADVDGLIGKSLRIEFRTPESETGFGVYIMRRQGSVSHDELSALDKVKASLPGGLEKLGLTEMEVAVLRTALRGEVAAPAKLLTEEFTIAGVIRQPTDEEQKGPWDPLRVDSDVLLPYETALDVYFRAPGREEEGINLAVLLVNSEKDVKDVVARVNALGLEPRAAIEFIERERLIYLLIFGGMTCVAGVALLVSALGIANTMLMSVLERTREIGIMKAVGADNGHLQFIFLVEGALIGLLGAGFGLLLAWTASYPGDAWVRSMVMRDIKIDLKSSIFVFPPWMTVTVFLFTVLVTTLAALYPARHAARIDPVSALRHE
jgi:putative ABC transport system permease protein